MISVYLAGKMTDEHGSWRTAILGEPFWKRTGDQDTLDYQEFHDWPEQVSMGEYSDLVYTGPYHVYVYRPRGEHSGEAHGVGIIGQHGMVDVDAQQRLTQRCMERIRNSDIVFAVLNTNDCYGTLAEIGYAVGLGKFVAVLTTSKSDWSTINDRSWFTGSMVQYYEEVNTLSTTTLQTHFQSAVKQYKT